MQLGTQPPGVLDVFVASIIMYFFLLIVVRIVGTRSLSTLALTDLACVLAIGAIVGRTILLAVPTLENGVVAVATLFALQSVLAMLRRYGPFGSVLTGRPSVLIKDGRLDRAALRRSRFSEDDLRQSLRLAGVSSCDELRRVVIEGNGRISVLRVGDHELDQWLLEDL